MARNLQQQLLDAYTARKERDGLTLDELIRLASLSCSPDSLSRKLRGEQSLRSWEIEKLASALRVVVTTGKSAPAQTSGELDDRAGVTMPTALQPVGGDQFDAGGAGQVERGGDAIGGHIDNMGPDAATRDVNPTSAVLTAVDGAAVPA